MSNYPDDCGFNSPHNLPWEDIEDHCPTCGSSVSVSSLDKDILVCENEQCDTTVDLAASGFNDEW